MECSSCHSLNTEYNLTDMGKGVEVFYCKDCKQYFSIPLQYD